MHRDVEEQNALFSRRAFLLSCMGGGMFSLLAWRLFHLQVLKAEDYSLLSEDNRFNLKVLTPSRGRLFDRYGKVLAENSRNFRVLFIPEQAKNPKHALGRLQALLNLSDKARARLDAALKRHPAFVPTIVAENLSWEDFAAINFHAPDISGASPDVGERRFYPYKNAFAHIVGYVAKPHEQDIKKNPVLRQPGMLVGRSGLEQGLEERLRGQAGRRKVEVNAYGRVIRQWSRDQKQPMPGQDITLTLSASLQRYALERFGEESGAAVVIDIRTGGLVALASTPSFDPNLFVAGIGEKDYGALRKNERSPLFSKAFAGTYAPASTFKMVTALAALETGKVTPQERFFCSGHIRLGDRRFHCWRRGGHGSISLKRAIKESCDVYFYTVGRKTGIESIAHMARQFGFGQAPVLPLGGIKAGIDPDPAWKRARYGQPWTAGDTLNVSIGQGYVLATPLQLALMTARLASGRLVAPELVLSPAPGLKPFKTMSVDPKALELVRKAMKAVCEEPGGTAYRLGGLDIGEEAWAGKTGTAQVRAISKAERLRGLTKNAQKPWRQRDHALFVGYAPVQDPRLAVCVVVEHGGSGSKAAGPIARDVLRFALLEERRLVQGAKKEIKETSS